jgi:hypothetical protein
MDETITGTMDAPSGLVGSILSFFGRTARRTSGSSVVEQPEGQLREYLRQMDRWLDWGAGFLFGPYMDKAGKELNRPDVMAVSHYDDLKTRYDVMVRRARDRQLI